MSKIFGVGQVALALFVAFALGLSSAARAQEPSKAQLDAARAAVKALHATDDFDEILPNAAAALKHSLIQAEPNLEQQINETVDQQALKLASRRGDLEKEVATIYAKTFSKDELDAIARFYNSEPGKKLLKRGRQRHGPDAPGSPHMGERDRPRPRRCHPQGASGQARQERRREGAESPRRSQAVEAERTTPAAGRRLTLEAGAGATGPKRREATIGEPADGALRL